MARFSRDERKGQISATLLTVLNDYQRGSRYDYAVSMTELAQLLEMSVSNHLRGIVEEMFHSGVLVVEVEEWSRGSVGNRWRVYHVNAIENDKFFTSEVGE